VFASKPTRTFRRHVADLPSSDKPARKSALNLLLFRVLDTIWGIMAGTLRIAGFLVLSAAAFGHHAYTAEFDTTKPIKLAGVLTKVEWTNPHIWLYLDVKDDNGKITNWGFSASPPGMLTRRGITKSSLKLGEMLTISGHRAKDGSNNASGNVVIFADGRDALIGQDQALRPAELAK
jgi:hypothetical protein